MAIRKNPDWTVWLGDVLYWASRPPGLYVCVVGLFGSILIASCLNSSKPNPATVLSANNVTPAPPAQQPSANAFRSQSVVTTDITTGPFGCPSGTKYDPKGNRCRIWEPGTQNKCRDDFIYIDRLYGCTYIGENSRYVIFPGNYFHLSGRRRSTLTVVTGAVVIWCDPGRPTYLFPGDTVATRGWMTVHAFDVYGARLILSMD
jgi:hypothetical protein